MRNFLLIIASLMCMVASGAESAESLLDRAAAKFQRSSSVTASYTVNSEGQSVSGTITLSGEKFVIDSSSIKSWYDGKTQWTYSADIDEVNITEPTADELSQVNPFAIISRFRKNFKARLISDGKDIATIQLTPLSKNSDMKKVDLTLEKSTLYPTKIVITMAGGATLTISIKSISEGMKLPDSKFRFTPSLLPGVEVIDLR